MRCTPSQERLAATSPPGNPHRRAPSPEPPPYPNPAASAAALPGSPSHHRLPPWSRRHHSFPPKIAPQPPPLASPASRPCSSTSGRGSAPQPSPSTNPDNHQPGRPPSRLLPPTRIRSTPQPSPPDCPCHWARPVPVLRPRPIHCPHLQFRVAQLHNSSGMLMFRAHVLLKRLTDVCVLCLFVCVCVRARVLRWQRHAYPHPLAVVQIGVQAPSK